ncbi:MAG: CoA-binding protein [Treponema sp.]|nr:CoA-binding protein [Treponema sp.]
MSAQVVIPEATRKRMLLLLDLLDSYSKKDSNTSGTNPVSKITSAKISELTGWKDSLIRHDLWLLGYNKGISNGYQTDDLRKAVEEALGIESDTKNCCIVGLNRLGAALLDEGMMEGTCFKIKAGFDSNVNRVEILRSTFPLYPTTEMNYVIRHENISLAILTVAEKDAQTMTDKLIKAGITGIVNMTRTVLKVPQNIKVENLSIVNALNLLLSE